MEPDGTFHKVAPSPYHHEGSRLGIHAPAKINLSLGVGALREDGFHQIDSIVCRIGMYDRILLTPRSDGQLGFASSGYNAGPDEENLALLAAEKITELAPGRGVGIHLEKLIPPGSGMGGGSSDAAAVLCGLNKFWELALPGDELAALAADLGSDVPFFLGTRSARITGRGEILEPVEICPMTVVIHTPAIHCSTAEVYAKFDESPAERIFSQPVDILAGPPSEWRDSLENQLSAPAMMVMPELSERMELVREATGLQPHITGSGSAIFIPCDDDAEADRVLSSFPAELRADSFAARINPW